MCDPGEAWLTPVGTPFLWVEGEEYKGAPKRSAEETETQEETKEKQEKKKKAKKEAKKVLNNAVKQIDGVAAVEIESSDEVEDEIQIAD